jgi:hypothetical protein
LPSVFASALKINSRSISAVSFDLYDLAPAIFQTSVVATSLDGSSTPAFGPASAAAIALLPRWQAERTSAYIRLFEAITGRTALAGASGPALFFYDVYSVTIYFFL